MFGDDVIASAILDRLLHHCHIISTTGPSYRIKDKLESIKQGARGDGAEIPDTGGEAYRADTDMSQPAT
ncbi:MAG: ATP-binding protein [Dehalococcoidia bacterium]